METAPPTGPTNASKPGIDTLKQLKQAEVDGESSLKALLAEGEKGIAQLRAEAEAAVHAARIEVDRIRERALQDSRARAEAEAAAILAQGELAAKVITSTAAKDLTKLRDRLLDVVAGEFRKNGSRPEA
jgi:vacuolar-type H+-ATPase subunit H